MNKPAYNVPVHAPLFPDPFVPYTCKDYVSIFAIAKVKETEIRRILSYTPFEFVSDKIVLSITDFSNTDKVSFMDCALVVPVKYGNRNGGYYFYEYENNDAAIAAGRDLWGYPKKYAGINLIENDGELIGSARKNGEVFLEIKVDTSKETHKPEEPETSPHLNIRTIPKPDGNIYMQEIIERDTSPDFVLHEKTYNPVSVNVKSTTTDPLHLLEPLDIVGGGVVRGDFYATEENGWGKMLERIYYDK